MSKVYFKSCKLSNDVNKTVYQMIERLVSENNLNLSGTVPLKVHFGEKGNTTYIKPEYYDGAKKYLKDNSLDSCYIETNVLYKSDRSFEKSHIQLAHDHGFNDLPVIIADGDDDHPYNEVKVDLKHFKTCKIGTKFANYDSYIIMSHFKGHGLAGYGGAIKQLAMGFAARGGKLHQHSDSIPLINKETCITCGVCPDKCPTDAIYIDEKAHIDSKLCTGCASCTLVCPVGAITNTWDATNFLEKLAEYAYAATKGKQMIYITYAFNITKDCDCVGKEMDLVAKDIGVFASLDPVASDKAILDMINQEKDLFKDGYKTLQYAASIGLGSEDYDLVEI